MPFQLNGHMIPFITVEDFYGGNAVAPSLDMGSQYFERAPPPNQALQPTAESGAERRLSPDEAATASRPRSLTYQFTPLLSGAKSAA